MFCLYKILPIGMSLKKYSHNIYQLAPYSGPEGSIRLTKVVQFSEMSLLQDSSV